MKVQWLGPPNHAVHLHGHGMIAPDEIVDMVDELAKKVVHDGRAVIVRDEADKVDRARKSARGTVNRAAVAALDNAIEELSE